MVIYPAIDIRNGKCVRLQKGDFSRQTVYAENPVEVALRWQEQGGGFLHLVDLDGAKDGSSRNTDVITRIVHAVDIPVQVGGGIRDMETVRGYLDDGVARVILGTAALECPAFVKEAVSTYSDRIAVGIDAKGGRVATAGWLSVSDTDAITFAKEMSSIGVEYVIYTDIDTDGMLCGPTLPELKRMVQESGMQVIASGGVSCLEDIARINQTGAAGAIIGKALYQNAVDLKQAVTLANEK